MNLSVTLSKRVLNKLLGYEEAADDYNLSHTEKGSICTSDVYDTSSRCLDESSLKIVQMPKGYFRLKSSMKVWTHTMNIGLASA